MLPAILIVWNCFFCPIESFVDQRFLQHQNAFTRVPLQREPPMRAVRGSPPAPAHWGYRRVPPGPPGWPGYQSQRQPYAPTNYRGQQPVIYRRKPSPPSYPGRPPWPSAPVPPVARPSWPQPPPRPPIPTYHPQRFVYPQTPRRPDGPRDPRRPAPAPPSGFHGNYSPQVPHRQPPPRRPQPHPPVHHPQRPVPYFSPQPNRQQTQRWYPYGAPHPSTIYRQPPMRHPAPPQVLKTDLFRKVPPRRPTQPQRHSPPPYQPLPKPVALYRPSTRPPAVNVLPVPVTASVSAGAKPTALIVDSGEGLRGDEPQPLPEPASLVLAQDASPSEPSVTSPPSTSPSPSPPSASPNPPPAPVLTAVRSPMRPVSHGSWPPSLSSFHAGPPLQCEPEQTCLNPFSCISLGGHPTPLTCSDNPSLFCCELRSFLDQDEVDGNSTAPRIVNDPFCGWARERTSRIVGGADAELGEYPWQAFVQVGEARCGGALISHLHVVTAAHCVNGKTEQQIELVLGDLVIGAVVEELSHEYRRVAHFVVHPKYRDLSIDSHDVAVLTLDRPVLFRANIAPICLPEPSTEFEGSLATVSGWGRVFPDHPYKSRHLQAVQVPVIENALCRRWLRKRNKFAGIRRDHLCAGYEGGGRDSCRGDSGGPLAVKREGRWTLIGVVSSGYGCSQPMQPGIYHRVSSTSEWISRIVFGTH